MHRDNFTFDLAGTLNFSELFPEFNRFFFIIREYNVESFEKENIRTALGQFLAL
jgi:hypothetical protein